MDNRPIFIDPKLKAMADKVPVELLRRGAERYDSLNPSAEGSWRTITSNLETVALAWTDWKSGFDIINIKSSGVTDRLGNYVITSKHLDIPASWAYTSLTTFIESFDKEEDVQLTTQKNGKLSAAERFASGASPGDMEDENDNA